MLKAVGFVCVCCCLASSGCGGNNYSGAQRHALTGKVTCDGEVVDIGSISFLPVGDAKDQRVSGGPIQDGAFAVPEDKGANEGTYRVEIRWQKKTGKQIVDPVDGEMIDERKEGLPAKFHEESELTIEVPSSDGAYDFDLTTK